MACVWKDDEITTEEEICTTSVCIDTPKTITTVAYTRVITTVMTTTTTTAKYITADVTTDTTTETATTTVFYGDADGDGRLSIMDAYEVLQAVTKQSSGVEMHLTAEQWKRMDVDCDGNITVSDAYGILWYCTAQEAGVLAPEADLREYVKSMSQM